MEALGILGFIGSTYPDLTTGVLVDGANRANIGCYNDGSSAIVRAKIYNAAGASLGQVEMSVGREGWTQTAIPFNVDRGTILWEVFGGENFCYAVNVNNASNDGTFLGRTTWVP